MGRVGVFPYSLIRIREGKRGATLYLDLRRKCCPALFMFLLCIYSVSVVPGKEILFHPHV